MSTEMLRCVLMPLPSVQVLLPNSSMVEVLPYAHPLSIEDAPFWVLGTMLWRTMNVPLLSMERLINDEVNVNTESYSRIIMVNSLSRDPKLLYFGLVSADAPHPIVLERSMIEPYKSQEPLKVGILSMALFNQHVVCIPDMEALAAVLVPLMHHHT